ncbi:MAG: PadR family transcriptional regulator [Clostridiales bacterium]|nr:PadR family transcriptional regulator [Clostridiales bacterium]
MAEKTKVLVDWDAEQKKIETEYKRKLAELKKMKRENEMVDRILTRGILPTLVLSIIYKEPSNGNEISTKISDITESAWQPSTGGIYPILKRLEKDGFVTGKWDDPDKRIKRIYTITKRGSEELKHQKLNLIDNLNQTVKVFSSIIKSME